MYVCGLVLLFSIIPACQAEATNYATTVKSRRTMPWIEANSYCRNLGGSLIDWVSIAQIDPTLGVLFWTAETIKLKSQGDYCAHTRRLCGFTHLTQNHRTGNVLFGDCNSMRSYACRDSHSGRTLEVRNATYNEAIRCTRGPTREEIRQLPPGYYWHKKFIQGCQLKPTDPITVVTDSDHVCSVYGRDIGHVYSSCSDSHYAVCLSETSTLETTDSTRHSTSYKHTETELSAIVRTTLITKQSTPKKTIWSTLSRTTPPATGKQQPDNIGVKIGVPIAVSLVVFCGVILAIVFIRRRQRKHNLQNDDGRHNVRRSKMSGNDNHNQGFELSGTDIRNIVGNDLYNVCEDSRNNQTLNENDEYSFVKTPEEPELHIYDHTSQGNEQYDTITPKKQTDIESDSVYNHIAGVETEDVYDSTIPGKLSRTLESDDVYNRLQVGGFLESSKYENVMKVRYHNV